MGTTVTTNLGLIKPDKVESIKANMPTFAGWASQNGTNCDKLDALFRATATTYTLNWTADTLNPTLGAGGFAEGKYIRLFPRAVLVFFRLFAGGAGFAAGTGAYKFNFPFTVAPELVTVNDSIPIGKAVFFDSSAALSSSVFEVVYTPTTQFFLRPPGGGSWSATAPIVPAQNDRVSGYFIYPTPDA